MKNTITQMTIEEYNKSIETGSVQLVGGWAKFTHYLPGYYFIFIPSMLLVLSLIALLQGENAFFIEGEIWMLIIPIVLAYIDFQVQKKWLKFKIVETILSFEELTVVIDEVAEQLKWKKCKSDQLSYTATTSPGFVSGSWGELITVVFNGKKVLVNSICDPKKRSSMTAFGRNAANKNTLIEKIEMRNKVSNSSTVQKI